jgi:EAL domain-containing protein (putative c-di-GMP-specific phosphodiesterase class I)
VALISGSNPAILESSATLARLFGLKFIGSLSKPMRFGDIEGLLQNWRPLSGDDVEAAISPRKSAGTEVPDLVPVYQPKYAADGSSVLGAEALMRVRDKKGQLLSPASVLAQLSESGGLGAATLDFLDSVLTDLTAWRKGAPVVPISINVPAPLLESQEFTQAFTRKLHDRNLPPSCVTIEVTETAMPVDLTAFVEAATRLRIAGFGLSLDDYGTGMSNYDILRLCPFTELKIDRSVVQSTTHDALACGFIGNCVAIARALKLKVVAEGVETAEQLEAVRRLGVDLVQGFYFSLPMPAGSYADLMRNAKAA